MSGGGIARSAIFLRMQHWWHRFRDKPCLVKFAVAVSAVGAGAAFPSLIPTSATVVGVTINDLLKGVSGNCLHDIVNRFLPDHSGADSSTLNHHIELAVGNAIEEVIQELIDGRCPRISDSLPLGLVNGESPHAAIYKSLIKSEAAKVWRKMLIEETFDLDIPDPQELLVIAAKLQEDQRAAAEAGKLISVTSPFPDALDIASWRSWMMRLAVRAPSYKPVRAALDELAPVLVKRFYWHLVQVLKSDFAKNGEAYAAIQIATTHSILALARDQSRQLEAMGVNVARLATLVDSRRNSIQAHLSQDEWTKIDERFTSLKTQQSQGFEGIQKDVAVFATESQQRDVAAEYKLEAILAMLSTMQAERQLAIASGLEQIDSSVDNAVKSAIARSVNSSTDPVVLRRVYALKGDAHKALELHNHVKAIRALHPETSESLRESAAFDDAMVEGDLLAAIGKAAEATKCYQQAHELQPANRNASISLATSLHRLHGPHRAVDLYAAMALVETVIPAPGREETQDAVLLSFASLLCADLANMGDTARKVQAEEYGRRALALDDDNLGLLNNYANTFAAWDEFGEQAEAAFKSAMTLSANHFPTLLNYAQFLTRQGGRARDAESLFARAIAVDPNAWFAKNAYGVFLSGIPTRVDDAERLYKEALVLSPGNPSICWNYALLLEAQPNRSSEAEPYFSTGVLLDSHDPVKVWRYARFLVRVAGKPKEAERVFRRVLELSSNDKSKLWHIAQDTALHADLRHLAVIAYGRLRAIDQANPLPILGLVTLLLLYKHDSPEAVAIYGQLMGIGKASESPTADALRLFGSLKHVLLGQQFLRQALVVQKHGQMYREGVLYLAWLSVAFEESEFSNHAMAIIKPEVQQNHRVPFREWVAQVSSELLASGAPDADYIALLGKVLLGDSPAASLDRWNRWDSA